jgi:hypothetical protein
VRCAAQDGVAVLRREMGRELRDPAQVEPAIAEHREQEGMLAGGTRRGDPQVRLCVRQMQELGAVREHRRRRRPRIQPPPVDLPDVGDEVGLSAAGIQEQNAQALEQLVVRDHRERGLFLHGESVARTWDRRGPVKEATIVSVRVHTQT